MSGAFAGRTSLRHRTHHAMGRRSWYTCGLPSASSHSTNIFETVFPSRTSLGWRHTGQRRAARYRSVFSGCRSCEAPGWSMAGPLLAGGFGLQHDAMIASSNFLSTWLDRGGMPRRLLGVS